MHENGLTFPLILTNTKPSIFPVPFLLAAGMSCIKKSLDLQFPLIPFKYGFP
jgi:hypothetical protein